MAPARRAADYTKRSVESVMGSRPVWMVPQVMNWAVYRKTEEEKRGLRPPTLAELRSMSWQCLTEGAGGLIYYSFFDLKKDTTVPFETQWGIAKQVAGEIKVHDAGAAIGGPRTEDRDRGAGLAALDGAAVRGLYLL